MTKSFADGLAAAGILVNYALLPIYIYECSKASRTGGLVLPRALSCRNYLQGYSCAEIEDLTVWEFGIATHLMDCRKGEDEHGEVIDWDFMVPSTMHWMADVVLRQNQSKYGYMVLTPPVMRNGVPSNRYSDKLYKPLGIGVKQKSPVNKLALFLFGHMLQTKAAKAKKRPVTADKRRATGSNRRRVTKPQPVWKKVGKALW